MSPGSGPRDVDDAVAHRSTTLEQRRLIRSIRRRKWAQRTRWASVAGLVAFFVGLALDEPWLWFGGIVFGWMVIMPSFVLYALARRDARR